MALCIVLLNGGLVDVDLCGTTDVGEIRRRVAAHLGCRTDRLALTQDTLVLEDTMAMADLDASKNIIAVQATAPSWYPCGKYTHDGKDVLLIVMRREMKGECGILPRFCYETIHYADGSHWHQEPSSHQMSIWTSDHNQFSVTAPLKEAFGFVEHKVADVDVEIESLFGPYEGCIEEWIAIPGEDPSEWEQYRNGWGNLVERRVGEEMPQRVGGGYLNLGPVGNHDEVDWILRLNDDEEETSESDDEEDASDRAPPPTRLVCPVCSNSGLLLDDSCPLCGDT